MDTTMIESVFDHTPGKGFLDPIAMSNLQRAYKGRKKKVTLSGIEYAITYGFTGVYPISGEKRESIRLNRTDGGLAPMGYISVKRILAFDFEATKEG